MGKDGAAFQDQLGTRLGQIARELGREVYPDGLPRGTPFSEVEDLAGILADEIARRMIESNVQGQAEEWSEEETDACPRCQRPGREAPDQTRVLQTTRGTVVWKERVRNCPRCRRDFFPSGPCVGP